MSGPHPAMQGVLEAHGAPVAVDSAEREFERLMDAIQTLIQLQPGDVLTQEMIDDLQFVDKHNREDQERAIDAFSRGYDCGLERGAGADTAKLIEDCDAARSRVSIVNALSSARERSGFIRGAQVCREMMARFVEQGGHAVIAQSIRLNWRPTWGDDPGAPNEKDFGSAAPAEIDAKSGSVPSHEILETLCQYRNDLRYPPEGGSRDRRLERVQAVLAKLAQSEAA